MRLLVQVVDSAEVRVGEETTVAIGAGLLVYVGIALADSVEVACAAAARCGNARILPSPGRPFDLSALQSGCPVLVVSSFSLYGNLSSGRRPSWSLAAKPADARPVYDAFVAEIAALGLEVSAGQFGAEMVIHGANHGPMNLLIEVGP